MILCISVPASAKDAGWYNCPLEEHLDVRS